MKAIFDNLAMLERSLSYHQQRHELLTSNLSNAQTPGYQPLDLRFDATLERAAQLDQTHPSHLNAAGTTGANHEVFSDVTVSAGNDGNSVSMERELAKMSANSIRFRALAEMVSRRLGMLHYAARDGQR